MGRTLHADTRGTSPVVAKTLAAGIVLLYVAGMVGLLLGTVVPEYESAAGERLGERVLATAAHEIEDAVPAASGEVRTRTELQLPSTIDNTNYRLVLSGRTLELVHPDEQIGDTTRLSVPQDLQITQSSWESGDRFVVTVTGSDTDRTLTIGEKR